MWSDLETGCAGGHCCGLDECPPKVWSEQEMSRMKQSLATEWARVGEEESWV